MDQSTLTLWGLAIAVFGVAATFVAPRFVGGARISHEKRRISRLDADDPTDRVSIRVYHDEELIREDVFLLEVAVENTGSKDVTRAEFLEPIKIRMGSEIEILSATLGAPEGVNPVWNIHERTGELQWLLLKPREVIDLKIVARGLSTSLTEDDVLGRTKILARLRDVKLGPGWRKYIRAPLMSMFALMAVLAPSAGIFFQAVDGNRTAWVYTDTDGRRSVVIQDYTDHETLSEVTFQQCPMVGPKYVRERCVQVTPPRARQLIAASNWMTVRRPGVGLAAILSIVMLGTTMLLGVLFLLARPSLERLFRRPRRLLV